MPFDNSALVGPRREIVIVDWTVSDHATLTAGIHPDTPVILLEKGQSGLAALARILADYGDLDAIHLVTHGFNGAIQLGGELIAESALTSRLEELKAISAALKTGGDLLLYGCSIAGGENGQAFLAELSAALGDVDIAASTDRTGPTRLGGDWDLEWTSGEIETVLPFSQAGMNDIGHCLGCVYDPDFFTVSLNGSPIAVIPDEGGTLFFVYSIPGSALTLAQVLALPICADAPPNTAPILSGASFSIAAIDEDSPVPSGPVGSLVSSFLGLGSGITDPDNAAKTGMAITAASSSNGTWYYWLHGPEVWQPVGMVSGTQSLLLEPADRLYFHPNANFFGTENGSLTFLAWDQTEKYAGSREDTTVNGGTTPFSTGTATLSVTITGVNDQPVLTVGGSLTAIAEDAPNPSGAALSGLGIVANDTLDGGTITGYLIVDNQANGATQGQWQYSTNGGTNWHNIGTVNDGASALALSASTLIRFKPVADYNGTPGNLVIRALDGSYSGGWSVAAASESRTIVSATTQVTNKSASAATANITTSVTAVNDAPVITNLNGDTLQLRNGDPASLLDRPDGASVSDVDHSNFSGGNLTVSFTGGTRADGANEVLAIHTGAGVSLSSGMTVGSQITVGGNVIGSIATSGTGSGTDALIITLTALATPAAVNALIQNITYQNITYQNTAGEPTGGSRSIAFVLTDSAGGASSVPATVTVTVNNSPVLISLPADISFADSSAADDFSGQAGLSGSLTASDADNDTLIYDIEGSVTANHTDGGVTYNLAATGSYGTLYLASSSGEWLFVPNNAAINARTSDASETFRLLVSEDGMSYSPVTHDLSVSVTGVNDDPVSLTLSSDTVSIYDAAQTVIGTLSSSDPDGPAASYSITAISTPGGAAAPVDGSVFDIAGGQLRAMVPGSLETGDYTITIIVEDGAGGSFSRDFVTTVNSMLVVTSLSDSDLDATVTGTLAQEMADGDGLSLREALHFASGGNTTIGFGSALDGQTITLASQADIPAGTCFQTDASLAITGSPLSLANGLTISNGSTSHLTIASDVIGTGDLTMAGSGIVTLSGAGNSLDGQANVTNGILSVTGSLTTGTGVTVGSGAILGGTGTINAVTSGFQVADGATLRPGIDASAAGVGTLFLNGNLNLDGTLALTLADTASHSALALDGDLVLGSTASLAIVTDASYSPAVGDKHQLVTLTAGATVTGNFAGATEGGIVLSSGLTHQLSYQAGDGNDLEITRVLGPQIQSVSATVNDGAYKADDSIIILVTLTEPVTVTGTPVLALANGATATYQAGSGSGILSFSYSVAAGDDIAHLDYANSLALTLPDGATITGTVTNLAANLSLPAPGSAGSLGANLNIVIDTVPPAPAAFDVIALDNVISASEKQAGVSISGTMDADTVSVSLSIAGNTRPATIDSISQIWSYQLVEDDYTAMGEGPQTLSVTASDAVGNSISTSQDVTVITVAQAPTISVATAPAKADSVTFTVTFADTVTGVDINDFVLTASGSATGQITDFTATGPVSYEVTVSNIAGAGNLRLDLKESGTGILDSLGNSLSGGVTGESHSADHVAPLLQSAVVRDRILTLTYDEALHPDIDPDGSSYLVRANGEAVSVDKVEVSGNTVILTLSGRISAGSTVTVSYTTPDTAAVQDSAGNPAVELTGHQVSNVTVDPEPPVTIPVGSVIGSSTRTVDGLVVNDLVVSAPNGAVKNVLEVPPTAAPNGNGTAAVIPLANNAQGQPLLEMHLPSGIGIRVESPPSNSTGGPDDLLLALQGSSAATAPSADRDAMLAGWQDFITQQPASGNVLVRSIQISVPAGTTTAPSQPVVITAPVEGGGQIDALVIDARNLPPGTVLQLDNVEFAFIIGPVQATGGAGAQYVIGDGTGQQIVLGADDDVIIGGSGNDVIGSKGGDDQLSGGAGDDVLFGGIGNDTIDGGTGIDVVRFDGIASDFQVTRNADGSVTVADLRFYPDPSQSAGTDLVRNAEFLLFTDGLALATTPADPVSGFDEALYLADNADVAAAVANGLFSSGLAHFAAFGWAEGRGAGLSVDDQFYCTQYGDVDQAIRAGLIDSSASHFTLFGKAEGRNPNAFFATDWYLQQNTDVAAAVAAGQMTAYDHYVRFGWQEGRDPSKWFDTSEYLRLNSDVALAGVNPLLHLLDYGLAEGRLAPVPDLGI